MVTKSDCLRGLWYFMHRYYAFARFGKACDFKIFTLRFSEAPLSNFLSMVPVWKPVFSEPEE